MIIRTVTTNFTFLTQMMMMKDDDGQKNLLWGDTEKAIQKKDNEEAIYNTK